MLFKSVLIGLKGQRFAQPGPTALDDGPTHFTEAQRAGHSNWSLIMVERSARWA